jgi:hypothetical protein
MTERTYADAIGHLTEAIAVLNRPGEGLGVAWGLQRGQAGWFHVVKARDELEWLRDQLIWHDQQERDRLAGRTDA